VTTLVQRWRPTRLAVRLISITVVGMLLAAVTGHAALVVVAAPALFALAWGGYRGRTRWVSVIGQESTARVYEDDEFAVELELTADGPGLADIVVHPELPESMSARWESATTVTGAPRRLETWTVTVGRWGHWRVGPWRISLVSSGLMWRSDHVVSFPRIAVFPHPALMRSVPLPPRLLARLGAHVSRRVGNGTEFAAVRQYAPGDSVRRVNWKVSRHRGAVDRSSRLATLYVNEFHAERTSDVVAMVDTTVDVGTGPDSSLDTAVRGAVAVTGAYLQFTDRVGVVGFGGFIRWLPPGSGTRHYYRVIETLMASRLDPSVLQPDLERLPRQAMPPGALVYCFTPLLEPRIIESMRDLRERGHTVVVLDTLRTLPTPDRDEFGRVALRLWTAERSALLAELRGLGIVVVPCADDLVGSLSSVAVALRRNGDRS